jgi:hypothetical protein
MLDRPPAAIGVVEELDAQKCEVLLAGKIQRREQER